MKLFLCVVGMVFIIEGLPYFAFPDKMKMIILKLMDIPESIMRTLGFSAMVTGLALLYFGTRS